MLKQIFLQLVKYNEFNRYIFLSLKEYKKHKSKI